MTSDYCMSFTMTLESFSIAPHHMLIELFDTEHIMSIL